MRARWVVTAAMVCAGGCGDGSAGDGSESSGSATVGASSAGAADETGGAGSDGTDGAGGDTGPGGTGGDSGGADEAIECAGNCVYVREGAQGDGSDWANALGSLPETLERGAIYFIADGSYPGYTFDDAGTQTIVIAKATAADHGDAPGWTTDMGDGEAMFGPIVFEGGAYTFLGRQAIRVVGEFEGTVVDIRGDDVTVDGIDVDGNFTLSGASHTGGACSGMEIRGARVTVSRSDIHDAADDGVLASGTADLRFIGNTIRHMHACGTDGGCGPCYNGHSDGLELFAVTNSAFIGNFIHNIPSTSAIFFGNWADELGNGTADYCSGITLANNIVYNPDTGFIAYFEDVDGLVVTNNVFWGRRQGGYGGLAIGPNVRALDMINNAILSINTAHLGSSYVEAEHRLSHNLIGVDIGQFPSGENAVHSEDPGFTGVPGIDVEGIDDPAPQDFAPASGSPLIDAGSPGSDTVPVLPTDFFGEPRDDTPNIGPIE